MTNRFLTLASILAVLASNTALGAGVHWIGTWSTAAQAALPASADTFRNQTVTSDRARQCRGQAG